MQQIYELSLPAACVSGWDYNMAIRELIYNGIDRQIIVPKATFSIEFIPDDNGTTGAIRFINEQSFLKSKTLLPGYTSKGFETSPIEQFGEGYKIASFVLNYLGKSFTVYNNMENEIWVSRFKNSEKGFEKTLTFFVEKVEPTGSNDLIIEVGNATKKEYEDLSLIWLGFGDRPYTKIETSCGDILLDEELKGIVYVDGLYIKCSCSFHYGYNFKPEYLTMENYRRSCDSWMPKVYSAQMISEAMMKGDIKARTVYQLIEEDSDDLTRNGFMYDDIYKKSVIKMAQRVFDEQNKDSIPVNTQSDYDLILHLGGHAVFVSRLLGDLLSDVREERIKQLIDSVK